MRTREPAVSICVPTWNGAAHLGPALESALAQTHADYELLIVDDGSGDGTLDVAASFSDPRISIHRNPRRLGIPANWNRCLERARGRYVKLLFQDDVLDPTAVQRLLAPLHARPTAGLAFSRREIRHEGPSAAALPLAGERYRSALRSFYGALGGRGSVDGLELVRLGLAEGADLATNVVGEPSFVLLRAEAVRQAGGFDTRFRQLADWEMWLRLGRTGPLCFVDESLGTFRVHPAAASAAGHRSLGVRWEVLQLLAAVRRDYATRLSLEERRRLSALRWRHRRHFAGETLRFVSRFGGPPQPAAG